MQEQVKTTSERIVPRSVFEALMMDIEIKVRCRECNGEMIEAQMTPGMDTMKWYRCVDCGVLKLVGTEYVTDEQVEDLILL